MTLYCDSILSQPVDFSWSEGYGETWDIIQPDVSEWSVEDCRDFLHDRWSNLPGEDATEEDWHEAVQNCLENEHDLFSPMMSYYYPLPGFDGDAGLAQAKLLRDAGSITLAEVNGTPVLALTGGGMDLSWDICHAYVLLGYQPPYHFCTLPKYARTLTGTQRKVLEACRESVRTLRMWCDSTLERLEQDFGS